VATKKRKANGLRLNLNPYFQNNKLKHPNGTSSQRLLRFLNQQAAKKKAILGA
jgi:hypothetical protein